MVVTGAAPVFRVFVGVFFSTIVCSLLGFSGFLVSGILSEILACLLDVGQCGGYNGL